MRSSNKRFSITTSCRLSSGRLRLWLNNGIVAAILCLSSAQIACADLQETRDSDLLKLEQKFFQHAYSKDPMSERLTRLEKMVFGEVKEGPDSQRLSNLIKSVPNLDIAVADEDESSAADRKPSQRNDALTENGSLPPKRTERKVPAASSAPAASAQENNGGSVGGARYPAVSAIEKKVFGKEFAGEPVESRLNRLETKVLGRPFSSPDLSERVDRLKQSTGIDIASRTPQGTDWDEEDEAFLPPSAPVPVDRNMDASQADGEDGKSFSGRDLRKDMQQYFGGSGSYGGARSGVASGGASGGYGLGGRSSGYPRSAPPANIPTSDQVPGLGLNQQVTALENEVFSKSYSKDPLPARLNRLESAIFPSEKPSVDKSLPERVARLSAVIPLSTQSGRRVAQKPKDSDFPGMDLDEDMPKPAPQRSGLGKIVSSIGNLFSGNGSVGGYPVPSGMRIDPQTGLMMDASGNLIDPNTGMIIGRHVAPPSYSYSAPTMMNNGFSPLMPGVRMGGMNFGMGGMGRSFGGMWP